MASDLTPVPRPVRIKNTYNFDTYTNFSKSDHFHPFVQTVLNKTVWKKLNSSSFFKYYIAVKNVQLPH